MAKAGHRSVSRERLIRRRRRPGSSPGVLTAHPDSPAPVVRAIGYGPAAIEELEITDPRQAVALRDRWPVVWIDVQGLGDAAVIQSLGHALRLHPLALEDVLHTDQRAKVDAYEDQLFVVARMAHFAEKLESEQVALFVGDGFVATFQERPGDCFEPVRQRIRGGRKRIRESGPDYLAYALLDALVDSYFPLLEQLGDRLEALEDEVLRAPDRATIARIHAVKSAIVTLRRIAWPHREALNRLVRDELPQVAGETRVFLRDCHDHAVAVIELIESYRDSAVGLMEVYLSSVSNKMNEVMKVLTIIATIFIPLGFIAGLYGMNFDPEASPFNMPELGWYWGYPFALALMALVALGLLLFFRRRGWLG